LPSNLPAGRQALFRAMFDVKQGICKQLFAVKHQNVKHKQLFAVKQSFWLWDIKKV